MNNFTRIFLRTAEQYAERECTERTSAGKVCVFEIVDYYGGGRNEAWCAKFVWVCSQQAAKALGIKNIVPKTAGALDMLQRCQRAGIRISSAHPAPGDIFYIKPVVAGSSGHVGIVFKIVGDIVYTIEGNASDSVRIRQYNAQQRRSNAMQFAHIAERYNYTGLLQNATTAVANSDSSGIWWMVAVLAIGVLGYYGVQRYA